MDDTCIPGFRRLAEAVHAEGAAIIGQIFHGGRELMDSEDGTLPVALAPSVVPNERFHVMPRAMSVAEIRSSRRASRTPRAGSGPRDWTAWRSWPATATSRRSSSARGSTSGRTSTAARWRTAFGSCARRSPRCARRWTRAGRGPAHLDRREHAGGPDPGRRRWPPWSRSTGTALLGLRQRRRRHVRDAGGLGPHRAADDDAERVHRAARRRASRPSSRSRSSWPGGSTSRRRRSRSWSSGRPMPVS